MEESVDQVWMKKAIDLAEKGLFSTTPNPRVGCVIIKNNVLVGEGWHKKAGRPHAEIMALKMAGKKAKGATLYTNLEPCSHQGQTGPCADQIIKAGLSRVVCGMSDPNPRVDGTGKKKLEQAGISVQMDVLNKEAVNLNLGFVKRMKYGKPWIRVKVAAGLDGKTALENGQSKWITSLESRVDVHNWRARSCAIVTGIGTLDADDPQLNVRLVDTDRQPLKVITDSNLRVSKKSKIFKEGNVLVATACDDHDKIKEFIDLGIEVLSFPDKRGKVDLNGLMKELGRRQFNEVMVEAGSRLHSAFCKDKLIDELLIYFAPKVLGERGSGMFDLGPVVDMKNILEFDLQEVRQIGNDIRIRARPVKGI